MRSGKRSKNSAPSIKPAGRPHIPTALKRDLLVECGHRCAVCGDSFPLENAHIIPWCKTHEHTFENLICLCPSCHSKADRDHYGPEILREHKRRPWVLRRFSDELPTASESARKVEELIAAMLKPRFRFKWKQRLDNDEKPYECVELWNDGDGAGEFTFIQISFLEIYRNEVQMLPRYYPVYYLFNRIYTGEHKGQIAEFQAYRTLPQFGPHPGVPLNMTTAVTELELRVEEGLKEMVALKPRVVLRISWVDAFGKFCQSYFDTNPAPDFLSSSVGRALTPEEGAKLESAFGPHGSADYISSIKADTIRERWDSLPEALFD